MSVTLVVLPAVAVAIALGCVRWTLKLARRAERSVLSSEQWGALERALRDGSGAPAGAAAPTASAGALDVDQARGSVGGASATASGTAEWRALHEVLAAPQRAVGVYALNELTAEVERASDDVRSLPPALARVALMSGVALGVIALATALRGGAAGAVWSGGGAVFAAFAGWGLCSALGRAGRLAVARRREQCRRLVRLLERRLPPQ